MSGFGNSDPIARQRAARLFSVQIANSEHAGQIFRAPAAAGSVLLEVVD